MHVPVICEDLIIQIIVLMLPSQGGFMFFN